MVEQHGCIVDVDNSVRLYEDLKKQKGREEAAKIITPILREDFSALSWELLRNPLPNTYFYKIIRDEDGVRMVHQSDEHWGRDILEGVSPNFRRGQELIATTSLRSQLLEAQVGETRLLISNKRDETESQADCRYTDTLVNVAEKVREDLVVFRQFQSRKLAKKGSIRLFNTLSDTVKLVPNVSIDTLITSIGTSRTHLETAKIMQTIGQITGEDFDNGKLFGYKRLEEQVKARAGTSAFRLLNLIEAGVREERLAEEFEELIVNTAGLSNLKERAYSVSGGMMVFMTSCGSINFGLENTRSGFGPLSLLLRNGVGYEKGECQVCREKKEDVVCGYCKKCAKYAA